MRPGSKKETKAAAREGGEFHEIGNVDKAITFPMAKNMVCIGNGWDNKPHGQATNESLDEAKKLFAENQVQLTCCEKMTGTFSHEFVNVAYEDSTDFQPFLSFNPFKKELVEFCRSMEGDSTQV